VNCPWCLKRRAGDEDIRLWEAGNDGDEGPLRAAGWSDADGSHLCWKLHDGECDAPEWWASVTPAEVEALRADVERLKARLAVQA